MKIINRWLILREFNNEFQIIQTLTTRKIAREEIKQERETEDFFWKHASGKNRKKATFKIVSIAAISDGKNCRLISDKDNIGFWKKIYS